MGFWKFLAHSRSLKDAGAHLSPSCCVTRGPSGPSQREELPTSQGLSGGTSGQTPGMLALFSCINKQGGFLPVVMQGREL